MEEIGISWKCFFAFDAKISLCRSQLPLSLSKEGSCRQSSDSLSSCSQERERETVSCLASTHLIQPCHADRRRAPSHRHEREIAAQRLVGAAGLFLDFRSEQIANHLALLRLQFHGES